MWKLGKHCPFQIGGEIVKLPANRRKKKKKLFFSLIGQQFLFGVKCWFCSFLMVASGFGVSRCWGLRDGSDPAAPWSLFILSSPPSYCRNINPFKKKKKKGRAYLCIQFNHRQMFIWASNGFGFLFLSYLTLSSLARLTLRSL